MPALRELILPDGERLALPPELVEAVVPLLEGCGLALETVGPAATRLERSLAGLAVALEAEGDWSALLAAELGQRLGSLGAACTVGEPPLQRDLLLALDVARTREAGVVEVVYGPLPLGWARRVASRMVVHLRAAGLTARRRWRPRSGGAKVAFRVAGTVAESRGLDLVRALLRALADETSRPRFDWPRLREGLARLAGAWPAAEPAAPPLEPGTPGAEAPEPLPAGPRPDLSQALYTNVAVEAEENVPDKENPPGARRARVTVGVPRGDRPPEEAGRELTVVRYRRPGG
ncbi:MAG: hypothetical protein QJR14_00730 [Bacillota bacterium]|nr:hypothetical protein [Bacillota bacterium]